MDDHQFRQLLNYFGFAWSGYRKVRKGVKKRVNRHMNQLECRNMADYLRKLDNDHLCRQKCELLMTVSVSRFFRDREFWRTLENKLLPDFVEKQAAQVKVWSAGCAGGDEVYSFKIVWDLLKTKYRKLPRLELLATDMNPEYVNRARSGIYSGSSLKELSSELQALYFEPIANKNLYAVKALLKQGVVWKIHHLLSDPPDSNFDIIFLRNNVLTYYQTKLKKEAFGKILESLAPMGLLIIGSHEALPSEATNLVAVSSHHFIFRKQNLKQ